MGSKWAKDTCLSLPNGPGSILGKRFFNPFLTHFWSQDGPFSRHFGIFHQPKHVTTGSKRAKNTCLSIPNGPGSLLEKCVFDPMLTHCCSQKGHFSRHFGISHWPKRVTAGSKWAKNTCLRIPNGPGSLLEKRVFDPFLTHFWSQNRPQNEVWAVSWATWLKTKFRVHLVHPQPPTFCGFQASNSPNETLRPPYQWSLGGAGGQPGPRTVGAIGGSTRVPDVTKIIFFTSVGPPGSPM